MNFINIKIKPEFAADLINSLYGDLEDAAKEIVEKDAEIERLKTELKVDTKGLALDLMDDRNSLVKELEEKDLMIEKLGKYRLELEQKHIDCIRELEKHYDEKLKEQDDKIRNMTAGAKVVSDDKYEAERDKLVKLVTQLQEENAELKMIMKMAGEKPGRGRPKKA